MQHAAELRVVDGWGDGRVGGEAFHKAGESGVPGLDLAGPAQPWQGVGPHGADVEREPDFAEHGQHHGVQRRGGDGGLDGGHALVQRAAAEQLAAEGDLGGGVAGMASQPGAQIGFGVMGGKPEDRHRGSIVGDAAARNLRWKAGGRVARLGMPLFEHLTLRAEQRLAAGDGVGGRVLLEEALLQRPGDAGVLRRLTGLLLAADPAGAVRAANDLVAASPGDSDALSLLGQALSAAGHAVDAVAAFAGAAGLRPDQGAMQCNLAVALLRAGRPAEAAGAAALSIQLSPGLAEAHAALGHARHALGERDAAMAAFQAALRCRPEHPDALLGIASVQSALGRPATAAVALQRACLAAPHWPNAWMDLGTALLASGNAAEAVDAYAQARALAPADLSAASNLLQAVQYVPSVTPERAASLARDWGEQQPRAAPGRAAAWGRPLRVGYVSADIRQHPVGWLGGGAIAAHDPEAVRVTLYLNQLEEDELTRFVAGRVHAVRRIFGVGDADVAAQIVQDGIDVLVDLSGHTGGNRLGVFARRPAPVQVSWLGYTATTGLPAMDAVLLDDDHAPPGHEALFTEAILRLPGGRFGYRPPGSAPEVGPPPMLSGAPVTFGSFNNPAKLNAEVVGLWSEVLRAVPGSRLLQRWRSFADPLVTARVRDLFGRNGFGSGAPGVRPCPAARGDAGRLWRGRRGAGPAAVLRRRHDVRGAMDGRPGRDLARAADGVAPDARGPAGPRMLALVRAGRAGLCRRGGVAGGRPGGARGDPGDVAGPGGRVTTV